jgi:uncharacterized protein
MQANSKKSGDFRTIQYTFTRHMRDPGNTPAPADVEDRRMAIYRDLLYRNVESFLANSFPVLRKVTPDKRWHAMVRDYFKRHQARTPLFPKMPQEFLSYLEQERDVPDDPPWLLELAYYEWLETALGIDPREIDLNGIDADGDLLCGVPVLNPLIMPIASVWPIHRISPDYQPETPPEQPTYLVVYRDMQDRVGFAEINAVTARLLDLIQQQPATGQELLLQIAGELSHPEPDVVIKGGLEALQALQVQDIVLGVRQ